MSKLEDMGRVIDADVLVIGGGFAGIWAAIRAKDFVDKVVLIDKAKVARSGCSTFAAGVQLCPTPDDDLDVWKKELVESGGYFPDQDWLDTYLENQMERVKDYDRWGVSLERDEAGKISRIRGRGHVNTRLFQFRGPKLMQILKEQALKKGVTIVERVMVTDLISSEGLKHEEQAVTGAIGINSRTMDWCVFSAKATILATGPMGGRIGHAVDNCTGDGVAAAFRVGAELTNMEFCTSGNITVWERKGMASGINMLQGHDAYFVNGRGERFMIKYAPLLMERSLLHVISAAFCKEVLEGRGPIYVDMRHLPSATFEKFKRVIPRTMTFWHELGVDPSRQLIECTPHWGVSSSSGQGGVKTDGKGKTNVNGLYAAGAVARSLAQGIYAVGGVATSSCNVMGYLAGENAAAYASEIEKVAIEPEQIKNLQEERARPLQVKDGVKPGDLFRRIAEITIPAQYSMFKNEKRITEVLSQIEKLKQDVPMLEASDAHELVKANEFKNHLLCTELVFRAALERKESRHYHYREDYPYRDDMEWLKLIIFKKENGNMVIRHESLPIDRWPVKPEKFVKTSHPVQMFMGE